MSNFQSNDPRAVRTRREIQRAFIELLGEKPYQNITVTDIAGKAGYARHTFYNHYETKDDLLANLIDIVYDEFFSKLDKWNIKIKDGDEELKVIISYFFSVWQDNRDTVRVLRRLEIDNLLIIRLKAYFTKFYYDQVAKEIPGTDMVLAKYIINFNAYTMLGILKPWLEDGMRHPPEVMAEFLVELTGSSQRRQTVERFKNIIR